ncbi:MAG: CHAT domain-containing protein, partial [Chloroflexota bacterium]
MSEAYVDLKIRIRAVDEERQMYPVEAEVVSPGEGSVSFRGGWFDLDEQVLAADRLDFENYGRQLYYGLFTGPVREAYDRALGYAHVETDGRLRLRLEIDQDAHELHAIRWEVLQHEDKQQLEPIATNTRTPFSRYTALEVGEDPPTEYPVKILFAVANPVGIERRGLAKIDVEAEIRNMLDACAELRRTGLIELSIMPGQSETDLSEELIQSIKSTLDPDDGLISGPTSLKALRDNLGGFHVFHLLAHGQFGKVWVSKRREEGSPGVTNSAGLDAGEGGHEQIYQAAVYLEDDENGAVDRISEDTFTRDVTNHESLQIVFLASCETARVNADQIEGSPLVGLAPKLVANGVPAVIAMQDVIEMGAAQEITASFYGNLFLHGDVDRALNEARYQSHDDEEAGWSVPVLFMRQATLFKADPVRATMEHIRRDGYLPYEPLPIEVAHLVGGQEAGNILRNSRGSAAAIGILDAVDSVFGSDGPIGEMETKKDDGAGVVNQPKKRARVALLVGRPGGAKTAQLHNISRHTVRQSLKPGSRQRVIPILVCLRDYPISAAGSSGRVERMVFDSLAPYWSDLTRDGLHERLMGQAGHAIFRILFDGSGDMTAQHRHTAWEGIRAFTRRYRHHQYILTLDRRYYDSDRLAMATDLLIMQPLSRRRVEEYLLSPAMPSREMLCQELTKKSLFDLAASSWLLIKMIEQANNGIYPRSRMRVLRNIFRQMLSRHVAEDDGRREWAEESLYRLAYQMYQQRNRIWDERRVFDIMRDVRRYREYSLDDLYTDLVNCDILMRLPPADVRFSRRGLQAYCCAQAIARMDLDKRNQVIDDITASLGRLTRLRWWEPVLVLLSGLVDNPNDLLRAIDFGIDMTEGEQIFLMARCLLEDDADRIDPAIRDNIVNALSWRLSGDTERRVERRARAADYLGQLHATAAADNLAWITLGIDQADGEGAAQSEDLSPGAAEREPRRIFDAGDNLVRLRAAMALAEIMSVEHQELKKIAEYYAAESNETPAESIDVATELYKVLDLWRRQDVVGLEARLHQRMGDHRGLCAVSIYALGDIASPEAKEHLIAIFFDDTIPADLRWAVTEALTLLDPPEVTRKVILPLLDEYHARRQERIDTQAWRDRKDYYRYLVYLIGRIRSQEPIILRFLDNCLNRPHELPVMIGAIKAVGALYAADYQEQCVDLAEASDECLEKYPAWLKSINEHEMFW